MYSISISSVSHIPGVPKAYCSHRLQRTSEGKWLLASAQGTPSFKWNTLPGLTTWTLRCSGGPKKSKTYLKKKVEETRSQGSHSPWKQHIYLSTHSRAEALTHNPSSPRLDRGVYLSLSAPPHSSHHSISNIRTCSLNLNWSKRYSFIVVWASSIALRSPSWTLSPRRCHASVLRLYSSPGFSRWGRWKPRVLKLWSWHLLL